MRTQNSRIRTSLVRGSITIQSFDRPPSLITCKSTPVLSASPLNLHVAYSSIPCPFHKAERGKDYFIYRYLQRSQPWIFVNRSVGLSDNLLALRVRISYGNVLFTRGWRKMDPSIWFSVFYNGYCTDGSCALKFHSTTLTTVRALDHWYFTNCRPIVIHSCFTAVLCMILT